MQENRVVVVAEIHEENEQEVPTDDDIRHVIVDGEHPTPSYLPPRITITEKLTENCMTSVISSYRLSKWMKIQGMYYWHPRLIIQTQRQGGC